MKKVIIPAALVILSMASCQPTKTIYQDYSTLRLPSPPVVAKPLVADLEVGNKTNLAKTYLQSTTSLAKESALAEFCQENKCDVVVNPQFRIEVRQKKKRSLLADEVQVSLSGFPGVYKRLHTYEAKDSACFSDNVIRWVAPGTTTENHTIEATNEKKKHKGLIWGGISLAALALLIILV